MTQKLKNWNFLIVIGVVLITNLSYTFGQSEKIEFVVIPKGSFVMGADIDSSYKVADKSKATENSFIVLIWLGLLVGVKTSK
jgi:hypothetical protein